MEILDEEKKVEYATSPKVSLIWVLKIDGWSNPPEIYENNHYICVKLTFAYQVYIKWETNICLPLLKQ